MEQQEKTSGNKGGRPVKAVKKNRTLTFKCSAYERLIIQTKAKKAKRTTSEYLREMALAGKIETKEKLFQWKPSPELAERKPDKTPGIV